MRKYYVVWKGRKTGIFYSWTECEENVKGYSGAQYKSFPDKKLAENAFKLNYEDGRKLTKLDIIVNNNVKIKKKRYLPIEYIFRKKQNKL